MTIQDVIDLVDSIEPNAYNNTQKAAWINECEGKVYTQLFLVQPYEFKAVSQALALPAPYDRMYSRYLQAMIHYADGEYNRYQNSYAMFNEVWAEANRWFGGDFDVTDRLRNREFSVPFTKESYIVTEIPEGCAVVAGRAIVKQGIDAVLTAHLKLDGVLVADVDMAAVGVTPMPMLLGGVGGSTLTADYTSGTYPLPEDGEIYIAGRLLIPDEKWHYDPAYAGRRDARWRS